MNFTRKENKDLSNSKSFLAKNITFVSSLKFRSVKSELKKLNDTMMVSLKDPTFLF